jgi:hypothetical protein
MWKYFILVSLLAVHAHAADSTGVQWWLTASGYASAYSSDEGSQPFHDLVTTAPRSGIGGNMIAGSLTATYGVLYGALTLQAGDVPTVVWQPAFPYVQEAWLGLHLRHDVRLEAGAFISHLGVESMIPFQNAMGIISISGFFDPNFFAGAKLYWDVSSTVTVHADVLTSYSGFQYEGSIPAFCASMIWRPDSTLAVYANSMLSDEPLSRGTQFQSYTNIYAEYTTDDIHALAEFNVGAELPTADHGTYPMTSAQLTIFHSILPTLALGIRGEIILDPHGIMANDRYPAPLPITQLNAAGVTGSIQFRPNAWSRIGFDLRRVSALDDTSIIDVDPNIAARTEAVLSVDVFLQ